MTDAEIRKIWKQHPDCDEEPSSENTCHVPKLIDALIAERAMKEVVQHRLDLEQTPKADQCPTCNPCEQCEWSESDWLAATRRRILGE